MVTFKNNNNEDQTSEEMTEDTKTTLLKKLSSIHSLEIMRFPKKNSTRNNQNVFKLFEKYNNLARETLSTGDKILSENYFQHADHFKRILNEQETLKNKEENLLNKKTKIIKIWLLKLQQLKIINSKIQKIQVIYNKKQINFLNQSLIFDFSTSSFIL